MSALSWVYLRPRSEPQSVLCCETTVTMPALVFRPSRLWGYPRRSRSDRCTADRVRCSTHCRTCHRVLDLPGIPDDDCDTHRMAGWVVVALMMPVMMPPALETVFEVFARDAHCEQLFVEGRTEVVVLLSAAGDTGAVLGDEHVGLRLRGGRSWGRWSGAGHRRPPRRRCSPRACRRPGSDRGRSVPCRNGRRLQECPSQHRIPGQACRRPRTCRRPAS